MTHPSFQEVILHRPFHQIVVDGRLSNFLEVFNGPSVVPLESGQIGDFEEQLIGQSVCVVSSC